MRHEKQKNNLKRQCQTDPRQTNTKMQKETIFLVFDLWPNIACCAPAVACLCSSCPLCNFVLVYQHVSSSQFLFVCDFWTSEHETNLPLTDSFLRAQTSLTRSIRANAQKSIPAIDQLPQAAVYLIRCRSHIYR